VIKVFVVSVQIIENVVEIVCVMNVGLLVYVPKKELKNYLD